MLWLIFGLLLTFLSLGEETGWLFAFSSPPPFLPSQINTARGQRRCLPKSHSTRRCSFDEKHNDLTNRVDFEDQAG